jgi:hypothetical protein
MLGAHLDSWFGGTGATDNGAGSVVMMEAIRILKALGLQPRRTVRIALWSGEEQGLQGSAAWVERHKAELDHVSAYVNVDNGTGRIRGIWNQSNEAAVPVFEQILWPFRDLGVVAVRRGNTGGTDHLSFDRAGVRVRFIQDPISTGRAHHTDADTFERLVLDDLKQAASRGVHRLSPATRVEMSAPAPPAPETGRHMTTSQAMAVWERTLRTGPAPTGPAVAPSAVPIHSGRGSRARRAPPPKSSSPRPTRRASAWRSRRTWRRRARPRPGSRAALRSEAKQL